MSDDKKATGSYTHLQIDLKYIAVNRHQYGTLDENYADTTIQHDYLHIPTKPLLLLKRSVPNCYIAILNHVPTEVITETCNLRYYQNILVPTTLVSTANHIFLLNVNICQCTIDTNYIIILGTHSNCTTIG